MTLVEMYINGLRDAIRSIPNLSGRVEDSPVRAHGRNEQVVLVMPGAEKVANNSSPRVLRQREIHVTAHTAGDEHLGIAESLFNALHPVVMRYEAPNLVQVDELQTDEPRYANGDLTRQVITKRYLITYQTEDDSLSQ